MKWIWTSSLAVVMVIGMAACLLVGMSLSQPVAAEQDKGAGGPIRVISTEGHNLIVQDAKTAYFYTIDEGAEIGSELKLRGTLDLTKVGQPVLTPKVLFKKGKAEK